MRLVDTLPTLLPAAHASQSLALTWRNESVVYRTAQSFGLAGKSIHTILFGLQHSDPKDEHMSIFAGMHEELLRLEFEHYDLDEDETITGLDFARSILSSVDLNTIDTYLDRAASLPGALANMKVLVS